ncbi:MAG: 50S ribosomal protein L15 [Candidatus Blackburnbacteria bacterium]|nr:50S ribosomal protein L15 [Candidatus Blackburnbacteria bacterium]
MISIGNLPPVKQKTKKRLGRGYGSGKGGHTASRGQKGQKSRSKIHPLFEGTKNKKSLIQRLPLLRGKGKLKPSVSRPFVVEVGKLNVFAEGSVVDVDVLVAKGVLPKEAKNAGVKILSNGKLEKKLTVNLPVTRGAASQIKALGGVIQE